MNRLILSALLLVAVAPLAAAPKNYGTITTRTGKSYHECKVVRVYPDGVGFIHKSGAARIAFKDLPERLRQEFRYDPKAEAAYQREQAARREEEKKRTKLHEVIMEEKLMEAQMAEASYLAAVQAAARSPAPVMSMALPGEKLTVASHQTPSWVGTPITGPALGGSGYRSSSYSYWGRAPVGGFGYGYRGGYYPYYPVTSYGYPYGSYGYGYPTGAYVSPTIFRSWNVGGGVRLGVGIGSFGSFLRVSP